MSGVLVIDVGTTGVRASVVRPDGAVTHHVYRRLVPTSPAPGFVEFDADALAETALAVAEESLHRAGSVDAVGIANQRASTIVFDARTGRAVAPGISWQDLRTAGLCLMLKEEGIRLAPNLSATKLMMLLDLVDPERAALESLRFATVDTWIAWQLSGGETHVTDASNAALTGLVYPDASGYDAGLLERLRIPASVLPEIVNSSGIVGYASRLAGSPPIAGIAGDQQASLIGQGCIEAGQAKVTFGTGGMLDLCTGSARPGFRSRGAQGCFPIVAWRDDAGTAWGIEAVMLSAGSCIEWLRDDLRLIPDAAASGPIAASATDTGLIFVPALVGLGAPRWDYGARGLLCGINLRTSAAEIVRAVLAGVAERGADLLEAAEADAGLQVERLCVDGGMSTNETFIQLLANATRRQIDVCPVTEATTIGAGFLAGVATGLWATLEEATSTVAPSATVEPLKPTDRERWRRSVAAAAGHLPEYSALDF
jgi:glycerol kinase